jgi:hypothetical protein
MWTPPISVQGKKQGIDGGYLGLSQLQHRPMVQHTTQNQRARGSLDAYRSPSSIYEREYV